ADRQVVGRPPVGVDQANLIVGDGSGHDAPPGAGADAGAPHLVCASLAAPHQDFPGATPSAATSRKPGRPRVRRRLRSGAASRDVARSDRPGGAAVRSMRGRTTIRAGLALLGLLALYALVLHPWLLDWGSTATERAMVLPGDREADLAAGAWRPGTQRTGPTPDP